VGVANPVLDGNHGSSAHCATAACNGPVLTVGTPPGQLGAAGSPPAEAGTPALNVFAQIQGITIEDADSALLGSTGGESGGMMVSKGATVTVTNARFLHNHANDGGGIDNPLGGTVTVSHSTFVSNSVTYGGGAIGNGMHGSGTLAVSGSTFSLNSASAGGAIATAFEGSGTVTVAGSTFSHNTVSGNGGAIDGSTEVGTLTVSGSAFVGNIVKNRALGEGGGGAIDVAEGGALDTTYSVSGSTFVANSAHYGGAINQGKATGTVSASTFSANGASYGGAVADGITTGGPLAISTSTFSGNRAAGNGGAINNAEGTGPGTVTVSNSTFWDNAAVGNLHAAGVDSTVTNGDGGAIDNADNGGTGTVAVSASTFSANVAKHSGDTVANDGTLFVVADIFNGTCDQSSSQTKWSDVGYNVGTNATCLSAGAADVNHGANRLAPLARGGGPTRTMRPLSSNPAVGIIPLDTAVTLNGNPVTLCPTTDQRGVPSAAGKACNAGAVQAAS
jgi:hypothetical protein